jgi:tryptophanyl-tRNA synthetase
VTDSAKTRWRTCLQTLLAPIRERRATYIQDKGMLLELLRQGAGASPHAANVA